MELQESGSAAVPSPCTRLISDIKTKIEELSAVQDARKEPGAETSVKSLMGQRAKKKKKKKK